MMQAQPNRQQATAQEQLQKHLLYNCLPLLAALILLFWLSFGLPQPTWGLLLKVMLRANMLIQQEGTGSFSLALIILVVQSICLLGAWILLIQGITREVKKILALTSGQPSLAARQPAVASAGPNPFQNPNANPYMTPLPSSVQQAPMAASTILNPYAPAYQSAVDATRMAPPPPPLHNPFESEDLALPVDSADDMPTLLTRSSDEDDMPTLLTNPQSIADIPTQIETPPPPSYEQVSQQQASATAERKAAHTSPYDVEDLYAETIRRAPAGHDSGEHNLVAESDSSLNEPKPDRNRTRGNQKRTVTSIQRRSIVPPSPETPEPSKVVDAASVPENRAPSEPRSQKNPYASIENDPLEATMIADRAKMQAARNAQESEPIPVKKVSSATSNRFANRRQEKQAAPPPPPSLPAQNDPFAVTNDDPFAVQEDVFNVFEQENDQENYAENHMDSSYEEDIQEEEEQASSEDDPIFVFGNPFSGPLPDVFMEDEDLKRSVQEQQKELSEDAPTRTSAAKKATGIRKRSKES